jgi:nitroreductase
MTASAVPVGTLTPDQVREVLVAATVAPSLHNTQPWRFRLTPTGIEIHADRSRSLRVADPDDRELMLGCGAALLNMRLATHALGRYPDVRLLPDPREPDLLARVRPTGLRPATPVDQELARAIPLRHTNRRPFAHKPVPADTQVRLRRAAQAEHSWLIPVTTDHLGDLKRLVHRAHELQQHDPRFTAEWRHWTGRNDGATDGVPARSSGPTPEPQDEWVLRDFGGGRARRRMPGKDMEPEPLIVAIGSFVDGPAHWLRAGQAMQRVLLTATSTGLAASFLTQLIEVPSVRTELRQLLGGGLWPQTVLRIGYGSPVPPVPRRPITDVVDTSW